jgi:hypothetical protein
MKMKLYFKTLYISSVVIFCLLFGFIGIAKAYENIRLVGFGEYRSAIEIEDGKLKIFDMEIVLD